MGCGDNLGVKIGLGVLSGGASAIAPGGDAVLDDLLGTGGGYAGDPLVDEALHTLRAYEQVAPEQLRVANKFNPQFAELYGKSLAATYAGTLPVYENQIAPTLARVNSQQRSADIADVGNLGPEARAAILASNPDSAAILELLNASALEGLQAGQNLTPEEVRNAQQASRAAFSARGLTGSNASIADEVFRTLGYGKTLETQRRGFAGNVLGFNQAVVGDPFMQILGRSGQAVGAANQMFAQGGNQVQQSGAGNLYDPFRDAYSTMFHNQDIELAKDNANKQLIGSVVGGALGAAGSLAAV